MPALLLVGLLLASAYAGRADTRQPVETLTSIAQKLKAFRLSRPAPNFDVQNAVQVQASAQCMAGRDAFLSVFQPCLSEIISLREDPSVVALETFCVSSCYTDSVDAIAQFSKACNNDQDRAILDEYLEWIKTLLESQVLCQREGLDFCYLQYKELTAPEPSLDDIPTKEQMDQVCGNPCLKKVANKYSAIYPEDPLPPVLDAYCYQVDGQYCLPQLLQTIKRAALDPEAFENYANLSQALCTPCVFAFEQRMGFVLDDAVKDVLEDLFEQYAPQCLRDGLETCLAKRNRFDEYNVQLWEHCTGMMDPESPSCPDTCKNALNSVIGNIGCCVSTYYDDVHLVSAVESVCGIKLPDRCRSVSRVKGALVVKNVRSEWVKANEAVFKEAFTKAVALFLGVSTHELSVLDVTVDAETGGVSVTFEIDPLDPSHALSIIAKAFKIEEEGAKIPLPLEAHADWSKPISFAAPSETDIEVEASAAAGLNAGLAVAAAIVVSAAANLF